ncbi:MAG: T9SS type A sorting domain-containing protein [Flavobacteriales bacterium]|nr:T9SS type A sorting domain-containing protein [Flavobacteriales bacterium]
MNFKTIIAGSLAVGLVIGGTLIKVTKESSKDAVYTPRATSVQGQDDYAAYMKMLKADPATGEIDPALVAQVMNDISARGKQTSKAALGMNWIQMGPDNVGGRCRAILVDKNNSNIVYAGSVTGGLYVSTDGSGTWTRVSGHLGTQGDNLSVSCITQTANGRIFFGTGSTFNEDQQGEMGSGARGNGVYEYVPATGDVVPVLIQTANAPQWVNNTQVANVNAVAARGNRLYIGSMDGLIYADPDGSGNYPSSFSSWTNPIKITSSLFETGTVNDIDIASDGSMVVCFSNKFYVMPDDNVTLYNTTNGLNNRSASRLQASIAPSNPNVIYMVGCNSSGNMTNLEISVDKGQNFSVIVPGGAPSVDPMRRSATETTGQGRYDMAIACDPSDWGHILVGGIRLFEWKYNPGSSPIGGSWLEAATIFGQGAFNPYYVHADKHTIVWPSASTIYIGSDGGVNRSTDGAQTWQQRNLGFNVTTFYDVACAANGWFIGGAQDNGNQLFAFQAFGEPSPLGTTEIVNTDPNITFGDGFDVAVSNIAQTVYATAQNAALIRTNSAAGGNFYDADMLDNYINNSQPWHTVIRLWETTNDPLSMDSVKIIVDSVYGAVIAPGDTVFPGDTIQVGDTIHYTSLTNGFSLQHIVTNPIILANPKDSFLIQDPIQSRFVLRMADGVYMTKDATRLNAGTFQWHKIYASNNAYNFEFSPDGNHLFIGTGDGKVVRISGLAMYNDSNSLDVGGANYALTVTTIATGLGGGSIVGLAIDPNDADNMIATAGGYSTNPHVYRCTNATTATGSTGNFVSIKGSGATAFPNMPAYDAMIDYQNKDKVIIASEWGVWSTDNAFSASATSVDWADESGNGMAHVPVHGIVQQHLWSDAAINSGWVYLGTHGQGFFASSTLATSIEENDDFADLTDNNFVSNLHVYPNPMNNKGMVEFNLKANANTTVNIFNLNGKLVKTVSLGMLAKGQHKESINVSSLSIGTYIMSLNAGNDKSIAKFIVTR